MKKITHILAALIITIVLSFHCCSSNDATDPVSENPETFLRYTVDGTTYQYEDLGTIGSLRLVIRGQVGLSEDANFSWIILRLPREPVSGTFDILENSDYELDLDSNPLDIENGEASEGSVTLNTEDDHFITGTFFATLSNESGDTVALMNGEFKAFAL